MIFLGSRKSVAEFVADITEHFEIDYRSITIIPRGTSGDFYALIAIDTSSEDTVEKMALLYSLQRITTSWMNIPIG